MRRAPTARAAILRALLFGCASVLGLASALGPTRAAAQGASEDPAGEDAEQGTADEGGATTADGLNEDGATDGGATDGGATDGGATDGGATDGGDDGASEHPDDAGGADGDVELDEWGLPIEDEEPAAPPPPYDVRLGYEVLGLFVGAIAVGALGFGLGAATAGIVGRERPAEEILLGAALGTGIAIPFGAALGVSLAGNANGGTGTPAGAILGALSGAAVGVALGLGLGFGLDDFDIGAIVGGSVGASLSLLGGILGYELTSGPHPAGEAEASIGQPVVMVGPNGALIGWAGQL
ncbi:MAG: hypothetical protein AB7S26_25810 [Sandaracinaceae bacterium]